MMILDDLLAAVDRAELALANAYTELEACDSLYAEADESDDDEVYFAARRAIRAAALKCETAYNAVTESQIDVDIWIEAQTQP